MTHPKYTQQALPRLKTIAASLGVTPTGDKRAADTWINAIITHQSAQTQKVADEQALAQAEFNGYITGERKKVWGERS
ncbi:MAG: hypothetical protein KME21_30050 [Desmonostoc vinosum HA7617-LM4]|jgi:hypothetical protein|nr:hypothetical protein [Desmonostoc vinosum HA7617-LM4]